MSHKKVIIHTDGACEGNPGPGGWAAILRHGALAKELSGAEPATTNNRMELTAAIAALRALKEPCEVEPVHRLGVFAGRHHHLGCILESAQLANRRPEACKKRRSVASTR